jgi:O-antigen/teichoic acid export membrane protein
MAGEEMRSNILKNYFSLFTGEIVSRLINYGSLILVVRIVDVAVFGKYSILLAIYGFIGIIVGFGLDTLSIQKMREFELKQIILQNIKIKAILCLIVSPFLYLSLTIFTNGVEISVIFSLMMVGLFSVLFNLDFVFKYQERMKIISQANILVSVSYFICILFFLSYSLSLNLLLVAFTFSQIVRTAYLALIFLNQEKKVDISESLQKIELKEYVLSAIPIVGSSIMIWVYYQSDTLLIKVFKDDIQVGIYSAAYKIIILIGGLQFIYNQSIFPSLAKVLENSREEMKEKFTVYFNKFYLYSCAFFPLLLVFSKPVIENIFGERYLDSVLPFDILLLALFFIFNEATTAPLLLARGKSKEHFKSVALGAILNLLLNLFLIPQWGLLGASISTVIAELMVFLTLIYFSSQYLKISIKKMVLKVLLFEILLLTILIFKYGFN